MQQQQTDTAFTPSAGPTTRPSLQPSDYPSLMPTAGPTTRPSLKPSVSTFPSSLPSDTVPPSRGVLEHTAKALVTVHDVPGIMDQKAVLAFESAALGFLKEMSPRIAGTSIAFTYVLVTGQTLVLDRFTPSDEADDTGARRLDDSQQAYELDVEFQVYADVSPGEPQDFGFQTFVVPFFEQKYDDFMIFLNAENAAGGTLSESAANAIGRTSPAGSYNKQVEHSIPLEPQEANALVTNSNGSWHIH
jgi:hypothetical protein